MKKNLPPGSIGIICSILIVISVIVVSSVSYIISTTPPSVVGFTTYGEVLAVEEADSGMLVTIRHIDGPSDYPGTHRYLIDDNTFVYDADMATLHDGTVGMLVWVQTVPFRKADFSSSNDYMFTCERFLIRQPTVPDWWSER